MRIRNATSTSVVLSAAVHLAGCGTGPVGNGNVLATARNFESANVFTRNGQAEFLVKWRTRPADGKLARLGIRSHSTGQGLRQLGWQTMSVAVSQLSATLAELQGDPAVVASQPNFVRRAIKPMLGAPFAVDESFGTLFPGLGLVGPATETKPNDPLYAKQYAPKSIRAQEVWARATGIGVVTAIVDTGVDTGHPDLKAHLVEGWNTLDNTGNVRDDSGHGTHVAGIAAALRNNREGIVGIAPDSKIMPVKVLAGDGSGSDETVASGIVWAADHGAKVINLSLGGPGDGQVLAEAVAYARIKGATLVAAMGNDGTHEKSYPASISGVIAVGATSKADKVAPFSQWGDWISVSAPGVAILSTFPTYPVAMTKEGFGPNYALMDGTSMATPAVAGAVAVLSARHPSLDPRQLKAKLEATADKVGGQKSFSPRYGHGRINLQKALQS